MLSKARSERQNTESEGAVWSDWRERQRLEDIYSGWSELIYEAFAQLSDSQLLRLHQDGCLVLNSEPNRFQHKLNVNPEALRLGLEHLKDQYQSRLQIGLEDGALDTVELFAERLRVLHDLRFVRIKFHAPTRFEPAGALVDVRAGTRTLRAFGRALDFGDGDDAEPRISSKTTPIHSVAIPVDKLEDWQREDGTVWFYVPWWYDTDTEEPLTAYGKPLLRIFETTEFDVISDAYDAYAVGSPRIELSGLSLGRLLDIIAAYVKIEWSVDDAVVRLRHSEWPYKRSLTVPRAVLREARNISAKFGVFTLDQIAEITAKVTDDQIFKNELGWSGWTPGLCISWTSAPYLRLYALEPKHVREAFKIGEPLFYGHLNPPERTLFETAFLRTYERSYLASFGFNSPDEVLAPTPAERIVLSWTAANLQPFAGHDIEPTQVPGELLSGDAALSLFSEQETGVVVNAGGPVFAAASMIGGSMREFSHMSLDGLEDQDLFKLCRIEHFVFNIILGSSFSNGVVISAPRMDPNAPYQKLSSLPANLRDRVREAANRGDRGGL